MPQKQFTNFRDQVNSFPLGESKIGLHRPGRYSGYDNGEPVGGLAMRIGHSGSIPKTLADGTPQNGFGSMLFPTGMVIADTDEVLINLDTNAGSGNKRIDLLIAEHDYQAIAGGTPASYSVIKGYPDGNRPSLSNPEKQIIIGRFEIPAGASVSDNVIYFPENAPLPGDLQIETILQLIQSNITVPDATELVKGKARIATQPEVENGGDDSTIVTPKKLFNLTPTDTRRGLIAIATQQEVNEGTSSSKAVVPSRLKVLFDSFVNSVNQTLNSFSNILNTINQTLTSHNTRITNLENANKNIFPVGMIMEYDQPYTTPPPAGWVNYFDRAGRVGVPFEEGDVQFGFLGAIGGEKQHTLTTYEIPPHNHPYEDISNNNQGGTSIGVQYAGGSNWFMRRNLNTGDAGGGQAHNNLQPYKVIRLIKYVGIS